MGTSKLDSCIKTVNSLHELVTTPFPDGSNAVCWPRTLPGDFHEVVEALPPGAGIVSVDKHQLASLILSDAGKVARDILLADLESLRSYDLQPELDCVHGSEREAPEGLFHTNVHSWHIDTATVPADTYLCTYVGATSECLRNEEAVRRVDVPETRAELLSLYGRADDAGFTEFLTENFYDLHYAPLPGARPFFFGLGNRPSASASRSCWGRSVRAACPLRVAVCASSSTPPADCPAASSRSSSPCSNPSSPSTARRREQALIKKGPPKGAGGSARNVTDSLRSRRKG